MVTESAESRQSNGAGSLELELPTGTNFQHETYASGVVWEYLIEGRLDLLARRH